MPLPDGFLSELKLRCDITETVSGYVNLKRRGRNMVGLCPFHSEKTPSFNVYPENGSFYCFGCGVGGDVITFIMKIENLDYIEAVRFLCQRVGMELPENTYDDGVAKMRTRIFEANREAARFFFSQLGTQTGAEGLNYLRRRALSDRTIKHFGLGYSPPGRYALCDYLRSKGFSDAEIVAANLGFKSSSGGHPADRFSDRVMFPIIDLRGNVIAFGGRILTDKKPKYLNTSDTLVFKKSDNLFSLNNAKNSGTRTLILCEGYMDVIALNQAGFTNTVATLGTALTTEQALLMKRYCDEVVICYDSDEAGQKATARAIGILRTAGLAIRIVTVPDGKDPDEYIRKNGDFGPAAFKNILENSGNDVEYRLYKLKTAYDISRSDQRALFLSEALKIVASLDSSVERDIYCSKLADELHVGKDALLDDLSRLVKKRNFDKERSDFRKLSQELTQSANRADRDKRLHLRALKAEQMLIAYLAYNQDMASKVKSRITPEDFVTDFNRELFSYILGRIASGLPPDSAISRDFPESEVSACYAILSSYNSQTATVEAMNEYIDTILSERNKLTEDKISEMSAQEIMSALNKKTKK